MQLGDPVQLASASLDIARWQFGIVTVYHFFFVPLTISLSFLTAFLQSAWVRTGKDTYLRATKFWGKLFLINIAMGVVTGIVQEFQFGMNWSAYSRFVGDVFGAPLAFEALIAFFFESTFIGLWIFGWDRLPRRIHLACIWTVAVGTLLSAYFILAANSWMQHPVGYRYNPLTKRAELTDFGAVLTQTTALAQFFHTISAAFLTGAAFMIGICAYHLARRKHIAVMRSSLRLALVVAVVAGVLTAVSGDTLGKVMFRQQPMKMAAAEALWDGQDSAPFSLFAVGDVAKGHNEVAVEVPDLLSFLATGDLGSHVGGINDVQKAEQRAYGPGDYRPNIPVAYWGFRWMIGFGAVSTAVGATGLWLTRRRLWLAPEHRTGDDEMPHLMLTRTLRLGDGLARWYWRIALLTMLFPLLANSWGWIFTETGRQPWVVYGVLRTRDAVTPGLSAGQAAFSLITLTVLYAVLALIEVRLVLTYAKAGPPELTDDDRRSPTRIGGDPDEAGHDRPMAFSY